MKIHSDDSEMKSDELPKQQRKSDLNRLVCYCFGYTEEDIREDLHKNGRSLILERIAAEKKTGGCRCAELNPSGK